MSFESSRPIFMHAFLKYVAHKCCFLNAKCFIRYVRQEKSIFLPPWEDVECYAYLRPSSSRGIVSSSETWSIVGRCLELSWWMFVEERRRWSCKKLLHWCTRACMLNGFLIILCDLILINVLYPHALQSKNKMSLRSLSMVLRQLGKGNAKLTEITQHFQS